MYKVNMPSKDSFSDSRYGQSYEHDHEDHYDHDTGYNSSLNTGMNFGNLGTGSLIGDLQKITNAPSEVEDMIEEYNLFTDEDKKYPTKTQKYKDWVVKTLGYLKARNLLTDTRKESVWLKFVKSNETLHDLQATYPVERNNTKFNNWKASVKEACEARHIDLPENLKPRQQNAVERNKKPKTPKKPKAKSSTSNQVTTNATAGLIHFTVREHVGPEGQISVTLTMKPNHPHHHSHHHPKPQE